MTNEIKRPSLAELVALDARCKLLLAPKSRKSPYAARYEVTAAGHVYRDDGRLILPSPAMRVSLCGGSTSRMLPHALWKAFGTVKPPRDEHTKWVAWVPASTPCEYYVRDGAGWRLSEEPVEGEDCRARPLCTIHTIKLVPLSELISGGSTGKEPTTRIEIVR